MSSSGRRLVLTTWALVAAALAGCGSTPTAVEEPGSPAPSASSDVAPSPSADVAIACTAIGNAEGVGVDLTGVLDLEGGDYSAEVGVPELGASRTIGFAGNDSYGLSGGMAVDLTSAPVTVTVVVRTETGALAYSAEDVAVPQLFQPNGPRCDGENHRADLVATDDGRLEPRPDDEWWEHTDEQGRTSVVVPTQCGVEGLELPVEGVDRDAAQHAWYARVGGRLDDGAGGPPPGWNAPYQRGWLLREGATATYTDDAGHREVFELVPGATAPPPTCTS